MLYVGHRGHDEAVGAVAQAPRHVVPVETPADVAAAPVPDGSAVAVLAQTTLAQDDWRAVVAAAEARFGAVWLPRRDDLCFATTNRQAAVTVLARRCDVVVVVGSATSSNTRALADTARRAGCTHVVRVAGADELPAALTGGRSGAVGVTAGASTPSAAVDGVVRALCPRAVELVTATREDVYFPLAPPVRRRLGELAEAGRLDPELHHAFVHDRATTADDLLGLVEDRRPGRRPGLRAGGDDMSAVVAAGGGPPVGDRWQYLAVLGACVLATLPLEVVLGARVWRRPGRLVRALAPAVALFAAWDVVAIRRGHWWFADRYVTGWRVAGGLPVEELAFFLVVPTCAVLTYEAVGVVLRLTHAPRREEPAHA